MRKRAIGCILVAVLWIWVPSVQAAGPDMAMQTPTDTNTDDTDYSNSDADIDPILREAILKFQAHDLGGGGKLLVQFVASRRAKYPDGYTFGFDAAEETQKHLTNSDAIAVISRFETNYLSAFDLRVREGIDAVLLQCYQKTGAWSAGTDLLTRYKGLKKNNYLLNLYALNFMRVMLVSGRDKRCKHLVTLLLRGLGKYR